MSKIVRIVRGPVLPLLLIAASCCTWAALHAGSEQTTQASQVSSDKVFFVSPLEETDVETVSQWAGTADVVVNVQVTSEREIEPPESENADEDGFNLIGRSVELQVTDVIWRSPDTTVPNPASFSLDAWGWMSADDGSKREVAVEGAARLEPGHEYVIALKWRETECARGDETVPAHWSEVGSGAMLPADDNTVGVGELEGSPLDLEADPIDPSVQPDSALAEFAGEEPSTMEEALEEAAEDVDNVPADTPDTCAK